MKEHVFLPGNLSDSPKGKFRSMFKSKATYGETYGGSFTTYHSCLFCYSKQKNVVLFSQVKINHLV